MNGNEFAQLAAAMKTYFPRDNMLPTDEAMDLWYDALKDIPYLVASQALKKYVMTNKFAPTIADIREQAASLLKENQKSDELNEMAAWNLVWKAVGSSGDYERAEKNFEKLPPIIQKTVRNPGQLREWALTQNINVEVVSSNFMRTYRAETAREKERKKLSPDLLKLIEATTKQLPKEDDAKEVKEIEPPRRKKPVPMPDWAKENIKF